MCSTRTHPKTGSRTLAFLYFYIFQDSDSNVVVGASVALLAAGGFGTTAAGGLLGEVIATMVAIMCSTTASIAC